MCTAREGRCEVGPDDCKEGARCRFRGVCSLDGLTCNLTSDADCRQTEGCKAWGKCTFDDYRCVIAGDDCRGTRACRELGSCTADEGKCIADSDADCQASEVCERYGWCSTQIVEDFLGTTKRCFRAPPKKL